MSAADFSRLRGPSQSVMRGPTARTISPKERRLALRALPACRCCRAVLSPDVVFPEVATELLRGEPVPPDPNREHAPEPAATRPEHRRTRLHRKVNPSRPPLTRLH